METNEVQTETPEVKQETTAQAEQKPEEKKDADIKATDPIPRFENRDLRYDFSAQEIHDIGNVLSQKIQDKFALAEEKKSVVANYGARDKELQATIQKLAGQHKDGYETRSVKVQVLLNQPETGKKTIIRQDTKTTFVENMNEFDNQRAQGNLFEDDEDSLGDLDTSESDVSDSDALASPMDAKGGKKKRGFVKGRQATDILNRIETGEDKPSKSTATNTVKGANALRVAENKPEETTEENGLAELAV